MTFFKKNKCHSQKSLKLTFQVSREVLLPMAIQGRRLIPSCTPLSKYSEFSPFGWRMGKERAQISHGDSLWRKIWKWCRSILPQFIGQRSVLWPHSFIRDTDHCHLAGCSGQYRYWRALIASATAGKSFVGEIIKYY